MNFKRSYCYRLVTAVSCFGIALLLIGSPAHADEPASLKLVPADAAFFSASAHLREQYDAFISSRAFAKLCEMPIVQMGLGLAQAKWNDPEGDLAPLRAMIEQPENKQLDGSLIPWDAFAEGAGFEISAIRDRVSKMKASLAIGVKDQYLLVSLGDSNDHLASLGQGEVLANHKELAPLRLHVQRQICSVGYVSEAFMKQSNSAERQLDQLVTVAESLLPLSDLDASLQEQLLQDVRGLVADLKKAIPETGAVTSFVYNSEREFYQRVRGDLVPLVNLSLTPKTTVRLLGKTTLKRTGVIGKHQEAAGAAMQFSFARLIDAVAPWVDHGFDLSRQVVDVPILDQLHTGFEIAKCLHGISAVTYQEDGAWVTHFEIHLEDLPQ